MSFGGKRRFIPATSGAPGSVPPIEMRPANPCGPAADPCLNVVLTEKAIGGAEYTWGNGNCFDPNIWLVEGDTHFYDFFNFVRHPISAHWPCTPNNSADILKAAQSVAGSLNSQVKAWYVNHLASSGSIWYVDSVRFEATAQNQFAGIWYASVSESGVIPCYPHPPTDPTVPSEPTPLGTVGASGTLIIAVAATTPDTVPPAVPTNFSGQYDPNGSTAPSASTDCPAGTAYQFVNNLYPQSSQDTLAILPERDLETACLPGTESTAKIKEMVAAAISSWTSAAVAYYLDRHAPANRHIVSATWDTLAISGNLSITWEDYVNGSKPNPTVPGAIPGTPLTPSDSDYPYAPTDPNYGSPVYPGETNYTYPGGLENQAPDVPGGVTTGVSRYRTAPVVTGSLAFSGAEGPGRMASVAPTTVFYVTSLSDANTVTSLGNGRFSGTLRGWAESHASRSVCIPLVAGSILATSRTRMLGGRKRYAGEAGVGKLLTLKMRHTSGAWNGDNCFELHGSNNVVQFLRTIRGTGNWLLKEQSGSGIVARNGADHFVGNCDMSLNSDQSAGVSRDVQRVSFFDNWCGRPIDLGLHSEDGGATTQSHGRGPLVYGGNDVMWARTAFFQLKDRQVAWSLLNATGHEINCLIVGCLRGAVLESKDARVNGTKMRVNIIKNRFIPGPLSGSYEHLLKPHDPIDVYAQGNTRRGRTGFRDTLGNGFSKNSSTAPLTFLANRVPHAPVREFESNTALEVLVRDYSGVSQVRDPLTGTVRDLRDTMHQTEASWIGNPSLIPSFTLTADPNASNSWTSVDPTIPTDSMTVTDFEARLQTWINTEFPGKGMFDTVTSAAGRSVTVLEHYLDDHVLVPQ